jgi:hypothetical protein
MNNPCTASAVVLCLVDAVVDVLRLRRLPSRRLLLRSRIIIIIIRFGQESGERRES